MCMPIYTCRYMFKMCGWWYEGVEFFFCLFLFCLKPTLTDFFGHLGPLQDNSSVYKNSTNRRSSRFSLQVWTHLWPRHKFLNTRISKYPSDVSKSIFHAWSQWKMHEQLNVNGSCRAIAVIWLRVYMKWDWKIQKTYCHNGEHEHLYMLI